MCEVVKLWNVENNLHLCISSHASKTHSVNRRMAFPRQDSVVLDICDRSLQMIEVLLSHEVSLGCQNNITTLTIADATAEVPEKYIHILTLIVHQFHLYQSTASAIKQLEKSPAVNEEFQLYISLTSYFAQVISAFKGELGCDVNCTSPKWRSAHLDFHMALALHDNSYTKDQQDGALKTMKRSWDSFKDKKPYKKVQDLTGVLLHELFCLNGDNMCGGNFEHTRSASQLSAEVVTALQSPPEEQADVEIKQEKTKKAVHFEGTKQPFEIEIRRRPPQNATTGRVKATAQSSSHEQTSLDGDLVDLDDIEVNVQTKIAGPKSKHLEGGGHRRNVTSSSKNRQPKSTVIVSDEEETYSEIVAGMFEDREDAKKQSKQRKSTAKPRRSRKKKAPTQIIDSESEDESTSMRGETNIKVEEDDTTIMIPLELKTGGPITIELDESDDDGDMEVVGVKGKGKMRESNVENVQDVFLTTGNESAGGLTPEAVACDLDMSESDSEAIDDTILPPGLDDWETWNRIAFEEGNSQIFLKLGAWMLLRFRQLAMIPFDTDVDGLVIPDSPRGMQFANANHFYEALGMERLYSAIAHIDTRPQFMRHLLYRLGRSVALNNDFDGSSSTMAVGSPPAVTISMMSDMTLPWLSLTSSMDADGDHDLTEEHTTVTNALKDMDIGGQDCSIDGTSNEIGRNEGKRKRTSSHASPPKKDGGRGPSKRPKENVNTQSASPPILPSTVLVASTPDVSDISMDEDADAIGEVDELDPGVVDSQAVAVEGVDVTESIRTADDGEGASEVGVMEHSSDKDASIVVESTSAMASNTDDWLDNIVYPSG
ncbi:hypothetical protein BDR07DRAFT_1382094 [Suillus spraguei]|nr:hypothetical protein BDR07DRAFT_1382094 [Suillus spraguei]